MMRLHVSKISDGPGPGEVVIELSTAAGGTVQVIVHEFDISDEDTIEVGHPIQHTEEKSLVELPRESISGQWRVWVSAKSVVMP